MNLNHNPIRFLFSALHKRSSVAELMDSADCDTPMLLRTVSQFKYINHYLCGIRPLLKRTLISHMKSLGRNSFTVIDLGSGGADIPAWLYRSALKQSIRLVIYCIDNNRSIASFAAENCKDIDGIDIVVGDIFDVLTEYEADYVVANHFLHHLSDLDIVRLLKVINTKSKYGFLINDLVRSRVSLVLFYLICTFFFRKSFTLVDGIRSISKGFVAEELKNYSKLAGIDPVITPVSPGHICMYSFN